MAITFDTYDFTDLIEDDGLECSVSVPLEKAPRRHGAVVTEEPTLEAGRVTLRGRFLTSTEALAAAEVRTMLKTLNLGSSSTARKNLTWRTGRLLGCYCRNFRWKNLPGTVYTGFEFEVEFISDDPFWYDSSATSASQVITYSPTSWAHTNSGDVLVYPVVTIAADQGSDASNFTFLNVTTNKSFTYAGTVTSGNSLVVDCSALTCKNNGASDLANFSGVFTWLAPGANTLRLTGALATVTVEYTARYYAP